AKFVYSDLRLTRSADGAATVTCIVRNTSERPGEAVVQVYLGAPTPTPAGIDFPVRSLAGFERIWIGAGGIREVRLQIPPERLRYWSLADNTWRDASQGRRVYVGASSRELPLSAALE